MVLRNLLYFIAILLFIGWILGFWVWQHEGHMVHIMLVLAIISLVLALVTSRKGGKDVID